MHFTKKTVSEKRSDLIKNLKSKKLLRFPGAYNPLCAKLIAEIGFDGVYVSGGVMSNDLGYPDIGLTSLEAMSQGCPVLISGNSALTEINSNACVYFNPDNENEIKDKIYKILNDNDFKNELINKGYQVRIISTIHISQYSGDALKALKRLNIKVDENNMPLAPSFLNKI